MQRQYASPAGRAATPPQAGQRSRERVRRGLGRPLGQHHLHDVGNDVAGALDQHGVAHADVLAADLVLVVQAHVADRDPGQRHGGELGDRRERAGLADVDLDRLHDGGRLTGGELEGDGPARMVRRGAEPPLLLERVDLDDRAVGVVAERVAVALELRAGRDDRVEIRAALGAGVGLEAGLAQRLEDVPVGGEAERVGAAQVIEEDVERPARGDRRVLLAHGAGGGVARVGEGRLAGFLQGAVELGELRARHEDLAAHLEVRRPRPAGRAAPSGWPRIVRRLGVMSSPTRPSPRVAPRTNRPALVEQRDAQAVDLRLAHVGERGARQGAADPGLELAQVVGRGRVVEREHRDAVLDRLEDVDRRAAPRAGWGCPRVIRSGKLASSSLQLAHERVVLRVGDLGPRLDVVEVVVMVNLLAQLGDALRGVRPRHARQHSTRGPPRTALPLA